VNGLIQWNDTMDSGQANRLTSCRWFQWWWGYNLLLIWWSVHQTHLLCCFPPQLNSKIQSRSEALSWQYTRFTPNRFSFQKQFLQFRLES